MFSSNSSLSWSRDILDIAPCCGCTWLLPDRLLHIQVSPALSLLLLDPPVPSWSERLNPGDPYTSGRRTMDHCLSILNAFGPCRTLACRTMERYLIPLCLRTLPDPRLPDLGSPSLNPVPSRSAYSSIPYPLGLPIAQPRTL